jgi:hypothetical protein
LRYVLLYGTIDAPIAPHAYCPCFLFMQ